MFVSAARLSADVPKSSDAEPAPAPEQTNEPLLVDAERAKDPWLVDTLGLVEPPSSSSSLS